MVSRHHIDSCSTHGLFLLLDTDECESSSGNCDDVRGYCMNTIGSFDCSCRVGYSGELY